MRLWLIGIGTAIIAASLIISHFLIKDLQEEEKNKMEIWAAAMKNISDAGENTTDLTLVLKVLEGNKTIPVVVLDNSGNIQNYRNIRIDPRDSIPSLHRKVSEICSAEKKIRFYLDDADTSEYIDIYYDDSLLLKRLAFYPYMQLTIVAVFVFIAVYMLVALKKSEQNKVWIGLSKETAHQLGTPISSLMAWQELLEEKYPDDEYVSEMGKDISRLRIIADRFSKIGSTPENEPCSVNGLLAETAEYISRRVGKNIEVRFAAPSQDVQAIRRTADADMRTQRKENMGGSERHRSRHTEIETQKDIHSRLHHQEKRLGPRALARQKNSGRISQRTHIREKLRAWQRHDHTHRNNSRKISLRALSTTEKHTRSGCTPSLPMIGSIIARDVRHLRQVSSRSRNKTSAPAFYTHTGLVVRAPKQEKSGKK